MPTIPLATYLLKRIHQLGITHIQGNSRSRLNPFGLERIGVPGDMNLRFLDFIEEMAEITWGNELLDMKLRWLIVGNANELNGAYSADGYARVKGAPGVRYYPTRNRIDM